MTLSHIHIKNCLSTQETAKTCYNPEQEILVTCSDQTQGIGTRNKSWTTFKNALAFSFSTTPSSQITLTSLEMGVLICQFLELTFNQTYFVKWPNDILNKSMEKCGGILIQSLPNSKYLVGVGLNIYRDVQDKIILNDQYRIGYASQESKDLSLEDKRNIPLLILNYINQNRFFNTKNLIDSWTSKCAHLNTEVEIINDHERTPGKFLGIGEIGQAIIQENGRTSEHFTGSLVFNHLLQKKIF